MARRLKVAHIITRLELGGAQQNTLYCCANHDRKKYDAILICGEGGYLDGEARKNKKLYKTYFLPELKHPIRPWSDFFAGTKLIRILKEEKVDIVHTHSSKAGILGRLAAGLAETPWVVHTVHGWGFYPGQFFLTRWIYQFLERRAACYTHRLITVSEANKREGLAAGIGKESQYRVIHSGIDPQPFWVSTSVAQKARLKLQVKNRPCVLVLSNLKKQKSPLDVVEVGRVLAEKIPEVLFLWAGDGPLRDKLEKSIAEKGLKKNFRLLGWRKEVAQLLAASDALLLTSIHEGLPRVVLQAMAAGKPVVATAVNGTPEAVKNGVTGFLHKSHDTDAMGESLFKLLTNPSLSRKMGQAGRKALKGTFLIGKMLQEIEKLYDELASRNK